MLKFFIISFFVFSARPGWALQKLKILSQPIPFFSDTETSGTFVELSNEIGRRLNQEVEIQSYPAIRSVEAFKKKQAEALIPGSDWKLKGLDYYPSETIFFKKTFIYSLPPRLFNSLDELANKTVGITLGYSYPPELAHVPGIEIQTAPSDQANLKKLQAKRIDAFLGEEYSTDHALAQMKISEVRVDKGRPIATQPIFYAFQKTSEGLTLKQKFDNILKSMKKTGELDKIVFKK